MENFILESLSIIWGQEEKVITIQTTNLSLKGLGQMTKNKGKGLLILMTDRTLNPFMWMTWLSQS